LIDVEWATGDFTTGEVQQSWRNLVLRLLSVAIVLWIFLSIRHIEES